MNQTPKENTTTEEPNQPNSFIAVIRGLVGMITGGVLGVYGFFWIVQQGFYAIILPGTVAGIGVRVLAPIRILWVSIVCAAFSMGLGMYTEWQFAPFTRDNSLIYFMTHMHQLKPVTLILITLGAAFGFWIADRR